MSLPKSTVSLVSRLARTSLDFFAGRATDAPRETKPQPGEFNCSGVPKKQNPTYHKPPKLGSLRQTRQFEMMFFGFGGLGSSMSFFEIGDLRLVGGVGGVGGVRGIGGVSGIGGVGGV